MIDTHAHLNVENYENNLEEILEHAKNNGVKKIIVIGMDDKTNKIAIDLASNYEMLYASVGIHPSYVNDPFDFNHLEADLKKHKVVAVGECGIDLYWQKENLTLQKKVFHEQILLAIKYNLPLIIHTRNSFSECYEVLKPYKGQVKGVFHCFSSSIEDAYKAIDLGFYLGVDGPITYKKNNELVEIVQKIDLKHWLIETDSPYLSPVPFRGKENRPGNVLEVAKKIAEIKEISLNEVIDVTTKNADALFRF